MAAARATLGGRRPALLASKARRVAPPRHPLDVNSVGDFSPCYPNSPKAPNIGPTSCSSGSAWAVSPGWPPASFSPSANPLVLCPAWPWGSPAARPRPGHSLLGQRESSLESHQSPGSVGRHRRGRPSLGRPPDRPRLASQAGDKRRDGGIVPLSLRERDGVRGTAEKALHFAALKGHTATARCSRWPFPKPRPSPCSPPASLGCSASRVGGEQSRAHCVNRGRKRWAREFSRKGAKTQSRKEKTGNDKRIADWAGPRSIPSYPLSAPLPLRLCASAPLRDAFFTSGAEFEKRRFSALPLTPALSRRERGIMSTSPTPAVASAKRAKSLSPLAIASIAAVAPGKSSPDNASGDSSSPETSATAP